uniref:Uncharacterized protein n=1 Tax=Sphaerodactylus townsendi TaxID=933632 RepID=A0ACB8F526_9SAUR
MLRGGQDDQPPASTRGDRVLVVTASADTATRGIPPALGARDLETMSHEDPCRVSTPSPTSQGSTPMPMMELTSPERRMTADRRRVRRVGVLADFAKAMVEQGEVEAMERRRFEDRREREVASFMQSRAEQNSELSSLRLAIDRGNDIMQTLVTALLQRMGSSGGRGAGGSLGASAPEVASHTLPAPAFQQCLPTCAIAGPAANLSGDAAEVTYPTLAEDTDLESCVGATAPLPSQVEELMMVGETSELCCTQVACQESQPMHKRVRKPKARMDL